MVTMWRFSLHLNILHDVLIIKVLPLTRCLWTRSCPVFQESSNQSTTQGEKGKMVFLFKEPFGRWKKADRKIKLPVTLALRDIPCANFNKFTYFQTRAVVLCPVSFTEPKEFEKHT